MDVKSKKILDYIKHNIDVANVKDIKGEINKSFVTTPWGSVVHRNTICGFVAKHLRSKTQNLVDQTRVLQIVARALVEVHRTSLDERYLDEFYVKLGLQLRDDARLQASINEALPIPSAELLELERLFAKKKNERRSLILEHSLLHKLENSKRTFLTLADLKAFFAPNFYQNPQARSYYSDFLKCHSEYAASDFEQKEKLVREALQNDQTLLASLHSHKKKTEEQRKELLVDQAQKYAERLRQLLPGEKLLCAGSYGCPINSLESLKSRLSHLPTSLLDNLPPMVRDFLKEENSLPDIKAYAEQMLIKLLQTIESHMPSAMLPEVEQMLKVLWYDETKSLPENVKNSFLPQCVKDELEALFQNGLLGCLLDFSEPGPLRDILSAFCLYGPHITNSKDRHAFIDKHAEKILKYAEEKLGNPKEQLDTLITKMFTNSQSLLQSEFFDMMGLNPTLRTGSFWLEFEKNSSPPYNTVNVAIYATGAALKHHPTKGETVQWPYRIYGVHPQILNVDFFRLFLMLHTATDFDCKWGASAEDLYEKGLVQLLKDNASRSLASHRSESRVIAGNDESALVQQMLVNGKYPFESVLAEAQLEALIDFLKPYVKDSFLQLPNEEVASTVESLLEPLEKYQSYLENSNQNKKAGEIRATLEEIKEACLETHRIKIPKQPTSPLQESLFPEPLHSWIKSVTMGMGISSEYVSTLKDNLCQLFGEEIRSLLEVLIRILPGYEEIQNGTQRALSRDEVDEKNKELDSSPTYLASSHRSQCLTGFFEGSAVQNPQSLPWKKKVPGLIKLITHAYFQWAMRSLGYIFEAIAYYKAGFAKSAAYWLIDHYISRQYLNWVYELLATVRNRLLEWLLSHIICLFVSPAQFDRLHQTFKPFVLPLEQISKILNKDDKNVSFQVRLTKDPFLPALHLNTKMAEFDLDFPTLSAKSSFRAYSLHPDNTHFCQSGEALQQFLANLNEQIKMITFNAKPTFILQHVLSFPMPIKGREDDIWNEVCKPEQCLKELYTISKELNHFKTWLEETKFRSQLVIANYYLLAIMDFLARRCLGNEFPNISVDISPFLLWIKHKAFLKEPESIDRAKAICHYFRPEIDLYHLPSDGELIKLGQRSLFNYQPEFIFSNPLRDLNLDLRTLFAVPTIIACPQGSVSAYIASVFARTAYKAARAIISRRKERPWAAYAGKLEEVGPVETVYQIKELLSDMKKKINTKDPIHWHFLDIIRFFLRLPVDPKLIAVAYEKKSIFKFISNVAEEFNLRQMSEKDTLENALETIAKYKIEIYRNYCLNAGINSWEHLEQLRDFKDLHEWVTKPCGVLNESLQRHLIAIFSLVAPKTELKTYWGGYEVRLIRAPNVYYSFQGMGIPLPVALLETPEFKYLGKLVQKPEIVQQLDKLGIEKHLPAEDKVMALFLETHYLRKPKHALLHALAILRLQASLARELRGVSWFKPKSSPPSYKTYLGKFKQDHLDFDIQNPQLYFPNGFNELFVNYNPRSIQHKELNNLDIYLRLIRRTLRSESEIKARVNERFKLLPGVTREEQKWLDSLTSKDIAEIETILQHPQDRIVRLLEYVKQNKSKIMNSGWRILWDRIFSHSLYLDQQLMGSPYVAQAIGEVLQELIKYSLGNDLENGMWIIRTAHWLQHFCAARIPASAPYFPDLSMAMQAWKNSDQFEAILWGQTYNYILDQDPGTLSLEKREEGAIELCVFMFRNREEQGEIVLENIKRFMQWKEEIQKLLGNGKFRAKCILAALKIYGISLHPPLFGQWKAIDSWIYTCRGITVHLLAGMTPELLKLIPGETLANLAVVRHALNIVTSPRSDVELEYIGEDQWISTNKIFRIQAVIDDKTMGCRIFKKFGEAEYEYLYDTQSASRFFNEVHVEVPEGARFWRSGLAEDGYIFLKMEGEQEVNLKMRPALNSKYEVISVDYKGTVQCPILLEQVSHNLTALKHFCPLNEIYCTITLHGSKESVNLSSSTPISRFNSIYFKPYDLHFDVTGDKAANEAKFPGFCIASKQDHPGLRGIHSFLLLESSQAKKVLIPSGQWVTSAAWRGLEKLGPFSSLVADFIQPYEEHFIGQFYACLDKKNPARLYEFDMDQNGLWRSEDPEAMAYITFIYLLQGKHEAAFRACRHLELVAKRAPLTPETANQLFLLALIPLGSEEFRYIRMRLFSALEENPVVHRWKSQLETHTLVDFWCAAVMYNDLYQHSQAPDPLWQLSSRQEWFLYRAFFRLFRANMEKIYRSLESDETQARKPPEHEMGWEHLFELIGLSTSMAARYKALKEKYNIQSSSFVSAVQKGINLLTEKSSIPSFHALVAQGTSIIQQEMMHASRRGFWNQLMKMATIVYASKFTLDVKSLEEICKKEFCIGAPLQNLNEDHFATYFFTYYTMARGDCGPERKKQIQEMLQLHCHLRRNQASQLMHYLDSVLNFPSLFPSLESFQKDLLKLQSTSVSARWKCFFETIHSRSKKLQIAHSSMQFVSDITTQVMASKDISKLAAGLMDISMPLLLNLSLYGTSKAYNAWKNSEKLTSLEKKVVLPIAQISLEDVAKIDEKVDEELDVLFHLIFRKEMTSEPEELRLEPFPLLPNPEDNGKRQEVNDNLAAYYENSGRLNIRLMNKEGMWPVYVGLDGLQKKLQSQLDADKMALLKIFEKSNQTKHPLTIEDIQNFILKNDHSIFVNAFKLNEEEIAQVQKSVIRCAVLETRIYQLERARKLTEELIGIDSKKQKGFYADKLEALADELLVTRAYSMDQTPRLLIRYLIWELRTKKMIWKKQSACIERVLFCGDDLIVSELLMGLGKTFMIKPIEGSYLANGKSLTINVWTTSLIGTNTRLYSEQASRIFNQIAHLITFRRNDKRTQSELEALTVVFKDIVEGGDTVSMTKEDAQGAENLLLQTLFQLGQVSRFHRTGLEEAESLRVILALLKTGTALVDEAHEAFKQIAQLVFPMLSKSTVQLSFYMVLERTMRLIADHPVIHPLILENNLPRLSKAEYDKIILQLATSMSRYPEFDIKEKIKDEFVLYVSGQLPKRPQWIDGSPQVEEICLVKGILETLFPKAAERVISVNYDASENKRNGEYARPSEGNNNVKDGSCLKTPYESLVKTFLMIYSKGLSQDQLEKFVAFIRAKVKKEVNRGCHKEETVFYRQFKSRLSFDIFDCDMTPARWKEVIEVLSYDHDVIQLYIRFYIWKQVEFWPMSICSNSKNFISQFGKVISDTGTPYNHGTYPLDCEILWDKGTIGEALHILHQKCNGIFVLENDQPKAVLKEILNQFFCSGQKYMATIDGGALLKGIPNKKVAKKMLQHVEVHMPHILAVKFFQRDPRDGLDRLVWIEKGMKNPTPIDETRISPEKVLTFFDHGHCLGTDTDLGKGSWGMRLTSELEAEETLQRLVQDSFRMRGLKNTKKLILEESGEETTQKILYVMTKAAKAKIAGQLNQEATLRQIMEFGIQNENDQAKKENYPARLDMIHNVVREAIMRKVIFAKNIHKAIDIVMEFVPVLFSKVDYMPKKLYGLTKHEVGVREALRMACDRIWSFVENSDTFNFDEKLKMVAKLDRLAVPGIGVMASAVIIYKGDNEVYFNPLQDMGQDIQIDVEETEEQEEEQEQEQEQETRIERHSVNNVYSENAWSIDFNVFPQESWLNIIKTNQIPKINRFKRMVSYLTDVQPFPFFQLRDVYMHASSASMRQISEAIPEKIWMTNNFLPKQVGILQDPAEVGSQEQYDLHDILVFYTPSQDGSVDIQNIAPLTLDESNFWKKKLIEMPGNPRKKAVVYNVVLRTVSAGHCPNQIALRSSQELAEYEAVLLFNNGNTKYHKPQRLALKQWLKKYNVKKLQEAFLHINALRNQEPYAGSDIEQIFDQLLKS